MNDTDITRELTEAQADVIKAREAPARRRRAVVLAREHGWSKYRIANTLGVKGSTVDSIIEAAGRDTASG
jgi:DNA-directed RNA polymerase specialized sigma24 family protein